jgi:hypothetical protein
VSLLLGIGCTSGEDRSAASPASGPTSATSDAAVTGTTEADPTLSARIELPSSQMSAGSTLAGHVVVSNDTGAAITATGCQSLFAVMLTSSTYAPEPLWLLCLQRFTIPTGVSKHPVTVQASTHLCARSSTDPAIPSCVNGRPPALPAGNYQAQLYQSAHVVPDPMGVPVTVLP